MKDITSGIFRVKSADTLPAVGAMLVAQPFIESDCFHHGVVSIIDYLPDEGATGVVMNNRTEYLLPDVLDGISPDVNIPVFCGGPLGQDRLFFIHTLGPDIVGNTRQFAPGLYIGGSFDIITQYVNAGYPVEGNIRFFIGYSNWVSGQLERELAHESWAKIDRTPSPAATLSTAGDKYWHRAVRSLGPAYRAWSLVPRNAEAN